MAEAVGTIETADTTETETETADTTETIGITDGSSSSSPITP
jgi:hypothetical protein